jgi:hypothetical protein
MAMQVTVISKALKYGRRNYEVGESFDMRAPDAKALTAMRRVISVPVVAPRRVSRVAVEEEVVESPVPAHPREASGNGKARGYDHPGLDESGKRKYKRRDMTAAE